MSKRLIILSDLWGKEKSNWLINYTSVLNSEFDITFYDSCDLGGINKSEYTIENIHNQFVNGGIEKAVKTLIYEEKKPVNILAFSIGGTIAWKFGIKSNYIKSLICVSSTRLRKESILPNGDIHLFFGENDPFKPDLVWSDKISVNYHIINGKDHEVYREKSFAEMINTRILNSFT
ncbi:alpha/beta hydrolase [Marinigracilibium pacificum]|uniref:Alpha/beta hydrolase n=1 Tax=Marinigracilibium pacificum TaxID=2729599 RepID=A0A848IXD5_9BACT|nr:alpha/beta hydrolase [Marinigracilibium pacificum]NMM47828.1 alpha/beta hydrolase [Marinigracilibium pacificum]